MVWRYGERYCGVSVSSTCPASTRLCGGREKGSASSRPFVVQGVLAHLVDDRTISLSSLPGPVILDLPQSSLPRCNPQSPLLQEHSTAVGQVSCKSVIHLVRHVLISLTNFLQQRACAFAAAGPIGHTSKLQYASLDSISLVGVWICIKGYIKYILQRKSKVKLITFINVCMQLNIGIFR